MRCRLIDEEIEGEVDGLTNASPELPPDWAAAPIGDVALVQMGQSPPSTTYNCDGVGLPFFQGKAQFGELHPEVRTWCSRPTQIALPGDILLSVRAPVGPTNLAASKCCIGRGLASVRPEAGIDLRYLLYAFRHYVGELDAKGTGTTFKAISGKIVREFPIPVAPAAEQSRISEALDELFSDLHAGVAALERARERLKLYRASVLKAAVEGALTADWRRRNPTAEPAEELLKRILVEHRRRWEKDQVSKFREKGKTPPKNWKARYKEPVAPDTADLSSLPDAWCWASLDQVSAIVGGITKGQKILDRHPTREVPYLRVANVQRGYLDLREVTRIRARESDIDLYRLRPGDILFTEGGDRDKLGRGWIWDGEIDECIHQNHVFRARLISEQLQSEIISWSGNSYGQFWFSKAGRQSVNLASINLTILRSFPVPVAPSGEQQQMVQIVEDQLSTLERLESDIESRLEASQVLRQALLKQAFCGKLVPQDPNDQPASELLKRIIAEREARERETAAATRSTKTRDNLRQRRGSRRSNQN